MRKPLGWRFRFLNGLVNSREPPSFLELSRAKPEHAVRLNQSRRLAPRQLLAAGLIKLAVKKEPYAKYVVWTRKFVVGPRVRIRCQYHRDAVTGLKVKLDAQPNADSINVGPHRFSKHQRIKQWKPRHEGHPEASTHRGSRLWYQEDGGRH